MTHLSKPCKTCGIEKDLDQFCNHRHRSDGKAGDCRSCTRERKAAWDDNNRGHISSYSKAYNAKHKERRRVLHNAIKARKKKNNPEVYKAREAVYRAVKRGDLIRRPCVRCGAGAAHGHHEDYFRPLEVTWLCLTCHNTRHREINAERRRR